jgi:hypothetical protein
MGSDPIQSPPRKFLHKLLEPSTSPSLKLAVTVSGIYAYILWITIL